MDNLTDDEKILIEKYYKQININKKLDSNINVEYDIFTLNIGLITVPYYNESVVTMVFNFEKGVKEVFNFFVNLKTYAINTFTLAMLDMEKRDCIKYLTEKELKTISKYYFETKNVRDLQIRYKNVEITIKIKNKKILFNSTEEEFELQDLFF